MKEKEQETKEKMKKENEEKMKKKKILLGKEELWHSYLIISGYTG